MKRAEDVSQEYSFLKILTNGLAILAVIADFVFLILGLTNTDVLLHRGVSSAPIILQFILVLICIIIWYVIATFIIKTGYNIFVIANNSEKGE